MRKLPGKHAVRANVVRPKPNTEKLKIRWIFMFYRVIRLKNGYTRKFNVHKIDIKTYIKSKYTKSMSPYNQASTKSRHPCNKHKM